VFKKNLTKIFHSIVFQNLLAGFYTGLNHFLASFLKPKKYKNSVLHISYMVHIPYYTVKVLRNLGYKADYLALGTSPHWNKSDFHYYHKRNLWHQLGLAKFWLFWTVMVRYEVIHSHMLTGISSEGWEFEILKKLGGKIVFHFRGCDVRSREENSRINPTYNICQDCDYNTICHTEKFVSRRELAKKYGDQFFVTTPDMLDFWPEAVHIPFFTPVIPEIKGPQKTSEDFRIMHATNHPGIEGTSQIKKVIKNLKAKGYKIDFINLTDVSPQRVLEESVKADVTIGKMKMGYYANAQIESMYLGTPAVTYVRPELMTEKMKRSGLIFTNLDKLEETLEFYINHPEELERKREIAKSSILELHDNEEIGKNLISHYKRLLGSSL